MNARGARTRADFIRLHYQLFFNAMIINPGLTKRALFRGSKQKVVSPLWQSKQCYQRSTYSHPETERRRMPHWLILPARAVALISWRKDQCRWRTPPHPLPSSLYICLNTWGILGKLYVCVYCRGAAEQLCPMLVVLGGGGDGWKDGAVTCQTAGMLMPWLW